MKTVFADFNAMSESGAFRLGCQGSLEDLQDRGIQAGDWMWLSDGELVIGAQLATDELEGVIGVPRWKTLVHLDDDDSKDVSTVLNQYRQLLRRPGLDSEAETRVFQLLTILEIIAPQNIKDSLPPGSFPFRRAGALHFLGEPALALIELEDALQARPDDPDVSFFYLETLRKFDPERAAIESVLRAESEGVSAPTLAACINIRSAAADRVSDENFGKLGHQILEWVARFERAPGRDQIRASILAQVQFNHGLTLLRLGRPDEAHDALDRARATNPNESAIDEALRLEVFDDRAREIAAGMREKPLLIAA